MSTDLTIAPIHNDGHLEPAAPPIVADKSASNDLPAASAALPAPGNWSVPASIRLSIGFIYFYFGFLKFFPDLSPAELIASQTVMRMTFFALDAATALWWLAIMECTIGLCFLFNFGLRWLSVLYLFHQISTFMPLVVYPELTFKIAPFAPTLEGQYILKNLTFVAIGWTVILPELKTGWRRRAVSPPRRAPNATRLLDRPNSQEIRP
jgi:uncharacterized membrane protein YphA (DoxX/SURF4 family)